MVWQVLMSTRSHYYEGHEAEYVKRIRAGQAGWDAGDYDRFLMCPFISRCLQRAGLGGVGQRALDLGCGTVSLSCMLAEAGFEVTGLDLSPTAISHAREMAARRKLKITFEVADLCQCALLAGAFDVIVDSHLLHCIVFESERRRLLEQVREALKAGGEFRAETMLLEDGRQVNPAWNLDERGVLWVRVREGERWCEAEWRDGAWWLPTRLIARSRHALLAALRSAGLSVVEWECYAPLKAQEPGGFRARCTKLD